MTTTESNKLIAEFMGYALKRCNNGKAWDIGKSIPSSEHLFPIQGVLHTGRELKFNTSWDWLMPVVQIVKERQMFGSQHLIDKIDNVMAVDLEIDSLYDAVVQFIQWYNQNQKSEWTENKLFRVEGYYMDDGMPIDWLVYAYDDCPEELGEDTIDYFGLSESQIKAAIESGEPIDGQYVFTSYNVEQIEA